MSRAMSLGRNLTISARSLLGGLLFTLVVGTNGCAIAKHAIRTDFADYNTIVQFNQTQQMLLNLVRLHYREAPMFLQAGALSVSYESTASGNTSASVEEGRTASYGIGLNYAFASKPTITYTPIEGRNYVQQLMSEVTAETFGLLLRAGWPITKLSNLLIEKVTVSEGATMVNNRSSGSYSQFSAFVGSLQDAQEMDQLDIVNDDEGFAIIAGGEVIPIGALQFRSLLDVMFFASKNTETPFEHRDRVKPTQPNGEMKIHVSSARPSDALVWVLYEGYYFSVDQTDVHSKDTLALLMQLFRIQASATPSGPLLTLPVR